MDISSQTNGFAEVLWQEYGRMIARSLTAYEADPALRQDLEQNVFIAMLQSLEGIRIASNRKAYISRIVHNVATDHICREVRHNWVELDGEFVSSGITPEQNVVIADQQKQLMRAVQQLQLPYRQVIVLLLEDFSQSEIAGILGLSDSNVRVRLNRAKTMLKAAMSVRSEYERR